MKRLVFSLSLVLMMNFIYCQDIDYAKQVVKKLSSKKFMGRGYVHKGDLRSARYIRNEFKQLGLKSHGDKYYQKFFTPVNTLPGNLSVSVNGIELIPGQDYLIDPGAPEIKGEFQTIHLTLSDLLNTQTLSQKLGLADNKLIVIEPYDSKDYNQEENKRITDVINFLKYHPDNPASGVVLLTKNKLIWGGSTIQHVRPTITINDAVLSSDIESITLNIESKFYSNYQSQNVLGYIEGQKNDSLIVFTAHYDHLGMMGKNTLFPGANDNASGVAMLLNLAKYYAENQPEYLIVFIAFGGEELGLLGSKYFTENLTFELPKVKFLINFDISGTGEDGIQIVNGTIFKNEFDIISEINVKQNLLADVKIRGEACNSDHCLFYIKGVPSFFIYTLGGIQAYHDIFDKSETLPLTEFEDYLRLITLFIQQL